MAQIDVKFLNLDKKTAAILHTDKKQTGAKKKKVSAAKSKPKKK